jgi:hypothetical protein
MERNFTQYASARARPTLGQQKTLDLKKARSLREIVWLTSKIGAAILAFVVAVSLLASFRSYLLRAPKFAIGIKEIQGLRHLSEGQVLLKLKEIEEQNRSLFALDLDALRRSVELLPWVRAATVRQLGISMRPCPTSTDPGHIEFPDMNSQTARETATLEQQRALAEATIKVHGPFGQAVAPA